MEVLRSIDTPAADLDRRRSAGRRLFFAGCAVLVAVVVVDRLIAGRGLAEEWAPSFTAGYLARTAGLAVASLLVMLGARRWIGGASSAMEAPGAGRPATAPAATAPSPSTAIATFPALAVTIVAVGLLLIDPGALNTLAAEDHVVEWGSAVLCFVAAAMVAAAAMNHWRAGRAGQPSRSQGWLTGLALAGFAAGLVLLGLEEVSWFQRVLEIESPEVFINRNGQKETNFHNMATTATGNGYYIGGFLFCIAAPFVFEGRRLPRRSAWLQPLIPSVTVLYSTALSSAIVYEMWNVIWIQMIFWMTLVAVVVAGSDRDRRLLGRVVAVVMIATAAAFLFRGGDMLRSWDDTEIRELIIPYGLAVYGLETWMHSRGQATDLDRDRG